MLRMETKHLFLVLEGFIWGVGEVRHYLFLWGRGDGIVLEP